MALTPLDFPASPTDGQTYPNPPVTGQPTYQWDAATGVWLSKFALGEEYVQLDGGQPMTGLLTLSGNPTAPMHAATKSYVDSTEKGRKNYIINGAMQVSQENGTTAGATPPAVFYPVDNFTVAAGTSGVLTFGQVVSPTPGGSLNRIRHTVTTADAAVAAGDVVVIQTRVEGLRAVDPRSGSASAKTVTLQFGVKTVPGTYCVAIRNGGYTRSYTAEFTIAAGEANTDVVRSVTITLDTSGTWPTDNTMAIEINWCLMAGATFQQAPNTWVAGQGVATTNQFNFMGSNGNVFELFDVSLTEGSVAPPFQVPDYASELALCQRYYWKWSGGAVVRAALAYADTTTNAFVVLSAPVPMRATPAVVFQNMQINGAAYTATSITMSANASILSISGSGGTYAVGANQLYSSGGGGSFTINARL